jgi:hypothetical protein
MPFEQVEKSDAAAVQNYAREAMSKEAFTASLLLGHPTSMPKLRENHDDIDGGKYVLRQKLVDSSYIVSAFTSSLAGSWYETSAKNLAYLQNAHPERWRTELPSNGVLNGLGKSQFEEIRLSGALKGFAVAATAFGANQLLDHTLFKDSPYSTGSAMADIVAVPIIGFLPCNPCAKVGAMVIAHSAGRLYDYCVPALRRFDNSVRIVKAVDLMFK